MVRVAIVEDQPQESDVLEKFLADYAAQAQLQIAVNVFHDPIDFISSYSAAYQLLLLDIQMPFIDGMSVAERIRTIDQNVFIVFVTNMAQFAVRGYKVEALDFILKPISYFEFSHMMDKVLHSLRQQEDASLIISTNREVRRISAFKIIYVEVQRHKLFYHLEDCVLESWGTLAALEESLPPKMFSKVNSGMLVNLNHVTAVKEDEITVSGGTLPLSRRRKKEFLADLAHYFGEERRG